MRQPVKLPRVLERVGDVLLRDNFLEEGWPGSQAPAHFAPRVDPYTWSRTIRRVSKSRLKRRGGFISASSGFCVHKKGSGPGRMETKK